MTDPKALVERLRRFAELMQVEGHPPTQQPLHDEAADLITHLAAQLAKAGAENVRLKKAIQIQANAVRSLEANKETEINRLRAKSTEAHHAVSTLDSEREANAILTERAEAAEAREKVLREAVANLANRINIEGSPYHTAILALDAIVHGVKRECRQALAAAGPKR